MTSLSSWYPQWTSKAKEWTMNTSWMFKVKMCVKSLWKLSVDSMLSIMVHAGAGLTDGWLTKKITENHSMLTMWYDSTGYRAVL